MTEGEQGMFGPAERGERAHRSIANFWLFVVLVLSETVLVLVLDRSCDWYIPPRPTRGLETIL